MLDRHRARSEGLYSTTAARARPPLALTATLLTCACALASATGALAATAPKESIVAFEGQLHGHQVRTVTLHQAAHTLHVTLLDGRKAVVAFSPSSQQRLLSEIASHGVTAKVTKARSPSHKLRYIVGGVAIVVLVAFGIAIWLLIRRRRAREEELGPWLSTRIS